MITCALLQMLAGLLDGLYALLPTWDWTIAQDIPASGANVSVWDVQEMVTSTQSPVVGLFLVAAKMNRFVPVDHFLYALQLMVLVVTAALAFRGVKWIINVVRGAGA